MQLKWVRRVGQDVSSSQLLIELCLFFLYVDIVENELLACVSHIHNAKDRLCTYIIIMSSLIKQF